MSNPLFIKAPFLTRKNFFNTNKTNNVFCLINPFYLSPHQTQVLELKIRDILSIGFFLPAKNCWSQTLINRYWDIGNIYILRSYSGISFL